MQPLTVTVCPAWIPATVAAVGVQFTLNVVVLFGLTSADLAVTETPEPTEPTGVPSTVTVAAMSAWVMVTLAFERFLTVSVSALAGPCGLMVPVRLVAARSVHTPEQAVTGSAWASSWCMVASPAPSTVLIAYQASVARPPTDVVCGPLPLASTVRIGTGGLGNPVRSVVVR